MWEYINNFLSVIGLLSIIITIIRIIWTFSSGSEWIDNIRIEEFPLDKDFEDEKGVYPQYYPEHPSLVTNEFAQQNLFLPQNTIIRNLVLKEVDETSINGDKLKYRKIAAFQEITPHSPLCLVIERREAIPRFMIQWKTVYGGKAQYYFCDNLRNGDNSLCGIQYEFGFWAKVRKILDLK